MAVIKGRFITVILLLLFLSICYSSAAHADQWAKLYGWGSDKDEKAYCIQQTSDGGYIVAGSRHYWIMWDEESDTDEWILKLDGSGQVVWQKTYSWQNDYATGRDDAHCIQQTSDGGYIVAGAKFSWGAGYYSTYALVFKLDGNGQLKWN